MVRPFAVALLTFAFAQQALHAQYETYSPAATVRSPEAARADGDMELSIQTNYLGWWVKKGPLLAPLLTGAGPGSPSIGAIGTPGTATLYNRSSDYGMFQGASLLAEATFAEGLSFQGGFFFLEQRSDSQAIASDPNGSPLYAHPFIDPAGTNSALTISDPTPGFNFSGQNQIRSSLRLSGYEANLIYNILEESNFRVGLIGGFRALDLNEDLTIQDSLTAVAPANLNVGTTFLNTGDTLTNTDRFKAVNKFYGGQIGARGCYRINDALTVSASAKVALGASQQLMIITGSTTTNAGGNNLTLPGGVYALTSNIGRYYRSEFAVVPEGNLSVGYNLASNVRATVGYNFLYWSNVQRPGSAVDPTINNNLIPSDPTFNPNSAVQRPAFTFRESDFWAQGVSLGLEFSF